MDVSVVVEQLIELFACDKREGINYLEISLNLSQINRHGFEMVLTNSWSDVWHSQ